MLFLSAGRHRSDRTISTCDHDQLREETCISFKFNQQRIETDLITKAFTLSQGNLSRAAHELGISRSTLYRRLRQYGLDRVSDAVRVS